MRVLLDTRVLLWAADAPERLGTSLDLLAAADERLISVASVWEIAIKRGLGKVDLGMATLLWVERAARELVAGLLAIQPSHAAAVEQLPAIHRDPFDRLLVAQARQENAVLLTTDRVLAAYGNTVRLVG